MKKLLMNIVVTFIFSMNLFILSFIIYAYFNGSGNFISFGIGVIAISASFGGLRGFDNFKRHEKRLKIMQWVVYIVGTLLFIIGACFSTCKWNV